MKVKKKVKLYAKNASERLGVFMKAFAAQDKTSAEALILQSKSMTITGTKLLRSIKSKQVSSLEKLCPSLCNYNFFDWLIEN